MALMAFRVQDFQDIFRNSNIKERKKVLAKVLHFPEFNEEDDLRTATLVDVYYEMLSYLVIQGFPWREVASFFEMFQCLLNETQGEPLVDAIAVFKEKLESCAQYSCNNNLKSVIDYVFLTYFQHYKLYQFVLTRERADDITKVHLIVEPPRPVTVMREAILKSVWDEQQRIKQIDQMEQERKQERAAQYEGEMQLAVQQLEDECLELDLPPDNLTTEQLANIVANVTGKKVAVTGTAINQKIDEMHDSLEFKYKRANVGPENEKGGRKSASSRRSKGNSGKK